MGLHAHSTVVVRGELKQGFDGSGTAWPPLGASGARPTSRARTRAWGPADGALPRANGARPARSGARERAILLERAQAARSGRSQAPLLSLRCIALCAHDSEVGVGKHGQRDVAVPAVP